MIGSLIIIALGAYGAYRLGCWVHDLGDRTTKHEGWDESDAYSLECGCDSDQQDHTCGPSADVEIERQKR